MGVTTRRQALQALQAPPASALPPAPSHFFEPPPEKEYPSDIDGVESDSDSDTPKPSRVKLTVAQKKERARANSAKYYAANKSKVLARQAKHYLVKHPEGKMRATTATKHKILAVPPKPEMSEEVLRTRIRKPLMPSAIAQTAINPVTSKYPPLSYLGIRDWIVNRTDRPEAVTASNIESQVSAWKINVGLMAKNIEAIDNVVPILNNSEALLKALEERYPNVSTRQKNIKLLHQITKYNHTVVLSCRRGLCDDYKTVADANAEASKAFEKSKQTNPEYAVPTFASILQTVKEKLGEDSQFYLFMCVYSDTVGRDDYGSLRIAQNIDGVDVAKYPNWFIKNGDPDDPNKYDPIIYVPKHKTGHVGKTSPKPFTENTKRLLKAFLDKHKGRPWLFMDSITNAQFTDGKNAGKISDWVRTTFESIGLPGLLIGDLRQAMATDLKKGEKTVADTARNAALMGHTIGTHDTNYGRMHSDEIERVANDTQINPSTPAVTKIAQRARKREAAARKKAESAARMGLNALGRQKPSEAAEAADLLTGLKRSKGKKK